MEDNSIFLVNIIVVYHKFMKIGCILNVIVVALILNAKQNLQKLLVIFSVIDNNNLIKLSLRETDKYLNFNPPSLKC